MLAARLLGAVAATASAGVVATVAATAAHTTPSAVRCGPVTRLVAIDGRAAARLGPVHVRGFRRGLRAVLALPRPRAAALLSLEVPRYGGGRITLRGRRCASGAVLRVRAIGGREPPTVPNGLPGRGATVARLHAPNGYYALFADFTAAGRWRLDALQGGRVVGSIVVVVR